MKGKGIREAVLELIAASCLSNFLVVSVLTDSKRNRRSRKRLRKHWQSWKKSEYYGRASIDVDMRDGKRW